MPIRTLYTVLAGAGALPFVASALLCLNNIETLPVLGPLNHLVASYGLAIASFMAGTHWGLFLARHERSPVNLFISSNVTVLFVWFAYLSQMITLALSTQTIALALLLWTDARLLNARVIDRHYFNVRAVVTVTVLLCLVVVLLTPVGSRP